MGGTFWPFAWQNPPFPKWFLLSHILFICIESFITGLSWNEECEACRNSKQNNSQQGIWYQLDMLSPTVNKVQQCYAIPLSGLVINFLQDFPNNFCCSPKDVRQNLFFVTPVWVKRLPEIIFYIFPHTMTPTLGLSTNSQTHFI